MHKNLFSTTIPIIDYDKRDFSVTHEEACRYAVEQGGVFSLNHPLSKFKRVDLSTVDIDLEVEKLGRYFRDNACFGAKLIEVGFPFGRYLPLSQHLRLWDMLSLEGHFLTGYGCNDAHSIKSGWYSHNNFAAFFGVDKDIIPTEKEIVEAMRVGRAYTADPVKVTGNISFATDSGIPMGAVVSLYAEQTRRVSFRADALKSGMKIRWIVNGNVAGEKLVDADSVSDEIEIASSLAVNFARVELYNDDGQLILLTNPIYFVREDLSDIEIPKERRY
jgi:hypothetical protein